jgi:S1-C subfamily serine protease
MPEHLLSEKVTSFSLPPGTLESLQRINTEFLRCVVPLFRMERDNPIHVGCGFFIDDGSSQYLVSAAHVLEQTLHGTLFLG